LVRVTAEEVTALRRGVGGEEGGEVGGVAEFGGGFLVGVTFERLDAGKGRAV
jgi:hypothetical protein